MQKAQVWTVKSRSIPGYIEITLKLMFKPYPFLKDSSGRES